MAQYTKKQAIKKLRDADKSGTRGFTDDEILRGYLSMKMGDTAKISDLPSGYMEGIAPEGEAITSGEYAAQNGDNVNVPQAQTKEQVLQETYAPTPEQWEQMPIEYKAQALAKKQGMPFDKAYGLIMDYPRSAKSYVMGSPTTWEATQEGTKDIFSMLGRNVAGATEFAYDGGDFDESVSKTEGSNVLGSIARSPYLLPSLGTAGALAGGAKQAGIGGATKLGFLGLGGGALNLATESALGEEITPEKAAWELGGGLLGEFGGEALKKGVPALRGQVKRAAAKLGGPSLTEEALEFASGAPWKKLESWDQLAQSAGKQDEIGVELAEKLVNYQNYLPEVASVKEILPKLPSIEVNPLIDVLEKSKLTAKGGAPLRGWQKEVNSLIDGELADLAEVKGKSMTAEGAFDLRKSFDADADFTGSMHGKEMGRAYNKAILNARKHLQQSLIESAEESGNAGYVKSMKELSEKLQIASKLKKLVGSSDESIERRAESFIDNMNNRNKSEQKRIVEQFDELFGGDISKRAEMASYAKQFGDGTPPLIPGHMTGKGALGQIPLSLGLASPAMASRIHLPALQSLGDVTAKLARPGFGGVAGARSLGELYDATRGQ